MKRETTIVSTSRDKGPADNGAALDDHGRTPRNGMPPPLERNIRDLMRGRAEEMKSAPRSERLAALVTNFLGSTWSVAFHATVFGLWIVLNLGLVPAIVPWDPTFVVLGMLASVEAIFLTTFVLINQNRLARIDEERSELALQIALLSEKQSSALLKLTARIADGLDMPIEVNTEKVKQLTVPTEPGAIVEEIRRQKPDVL